MVIEKWRDLMATTFDDPRIEKFYSQVPEAQLQRLEHFRARYPYREVELDGIRWRYIDSAEGKRILLALAGGTTIAEISFNTLEHLAQQHRIIAPDYPPINTIEALFQATIELLDYLGIERFDLLGGSYGGWMAQSFIRSYPDRIDKVLLSAIGPPNPENSRQLARMMWLFRLAPLGLIRALMSRSFKRLVGKGEATPEQMLLMAQLQEIMSTRVRKVDILAALRRLIDQTDHYTFHAEDLSEWHGQMLILMASEDPATTPEKREAMQVLYPEAEHVLFEGADHSMAVTHREEYYAAIDRFLST
jgi:pimeloyl-ACP methyl ester carboxylesterase